MVVACAIGYALISEDRGLSSALARNQAEAGPSVGFGLGVAGSGQPVECSDNEGLARDCALLLSVRTALAGGSELGWDADAPVSEWKGVVEAGEPPRVVALNLTTAGLSGYIPPELGGLSDLRALHLYGNELSGEIPPELGRLTKLDTLDLGDNRLTGEIPPELGDLAGLVSLDLSVNQLSGEIPARIGELERLEWLVIAENQLTGSVTETLQDLPNLDYLNIEGNDLSGCVPVRLKDVDGFLGGLPVCDGGLNRSQESRDSSRTDSQSLRLGVTEKSRMSVRRISLMDTWPVGRWAPLNSGRVAIAP